MSVNQSPTTEIMVNKKGLQMDDKLTRQELTTLIFSLQLRIDDKKSKFDVEVGTIRYIEQIQNKLYKQLRKG